MEETIGSSGSAPETAPSRAGSALVLGAGFAVVCLLAGLAWESAGAMVSPMDWLAHGGPRRLAIWSGASIIPAFLLGAWLLTAPGSRAVMMIMAGVAALPVIAILNGSVYRTAVVRSAGFVSGQLGPAAKAIGEELKNKGSVPADISGLLRKAEGLGEARLYSGQGYFILSTGGFADQGEGATIFYNSKTGEWRRFHEDRAQSPAAREFSEATAGIAPSRYVRGPEGAWRRN